MTVNAFVDDYVLFAGCQSYTLEKISKNCQKHFLTFKNFLDGDLDLETLNSDRDPDRR